jgi:membrane-bound serine protease (ClpP class)
VVGLLTDAEVVVTSAALVPFILGSLLLFAPFTLTSPALPDLRVSPWLIGGMSVGMLAFTLVVLRAVLSASRMPPRSGAERLVGQRGTALTDLTPDGQVRVDLDNWSAVALGERIRAGDPVEVVGVAGVHLEVMAVDREQERGSGNEGGG